MTLKISNALDSKLFSAQRSYLSVCAVLRHMASSLLPSSREIASHLSSLSTSVFFRSFRLIFSPPLSACLQVSLLPSLIRHRSGASKRAKQAGYSNTLQTEQ